MALKNVEQGVTAAAYNEKYASEVEGCGIQLDGEGLDNPIQAISAKVTAVYRKDGKRENADADVVYNKSGIAEFAIDFSGVTLRQLLEIAIGTIKTRVNIDNEVADVIPAALPKGESNKKGSLKVTALREQLKAAGLSDEQIEAVIAASRK